MFANQAANATIDNEHGLRRSDSSIAATSLSDAVHLEVTINQVAASERLSQAERRQTTLRLRRRSTEQPLIFSVMPIDKKPGSEADSSVIVYVFDPAADIMPLMSSVCELYGLSLAEERMATLIATGTALSEAARARRIKEPTARTYLK